ncbi:MAG: type II secretion system F family protein [Bacillota bacterium]
MPQCYNYRARTPQGELVVGFLDAENQTAAVNALRGKNLFVVDIKPASEKSRDLISGALHAKVSHRDLAVFCRQFSVMLEAGLPIFQALNVLVQQTEKKYLRETTIKVVNRLEEGLSLAEAMRLYPKVFPLILTRMVEAGEISGTLEQVLGRLATHFEKEQQTREAIRGALTYPAIVFIVAAIAVGVLLTFVVPTFERVFQGLDVAVPLSTQVLLQVSRFFQRFWWAVLGGAVLIIAGLSYFLRSTVEGKEIWDRFILRLPVVGTLVKKAIVARFARTLGTIIGSGVPIITALEVAKRTTGNVVIAQAIERTIENVAEGGTIAGLLERSGVFPPMMTRMIAVGEETGALEELLEKAAAFYEQDVEATVKRLPVTIEPLLIIVLGGVVLLIVVSILTPIFSIYESLQ